MKVTLENGHSSHNVHPDKQSEIFGTCAQSQTYHIIINLFTQTFRVKERHDLSVSGHRWLSLPITRTWSSYLSPFFFVTEGVSIGGTAPPPNLIIGGPGPPPPPRSYAHEQQQNNQTENSNVLYVCPTKEPTTSLVQHTEL